MSQRQTPRNGMYYTNYSGKVWQTNDLTHATQEPHARSFSSTGFSRMDRIFADSSDEATYDIQSVFSDSSDAESSDSTSTSSSFKYKKEIVHNVLGEYRSFFCSTQLNMNDAGSTSISSSNKNEKLPMLKALQTSTSSSSSSTQSDASEETQVKGAQMKDCITAETNKDSCALFEPLPPASNEDKSEIETENGAAPTNERSLLTNDSSSSNNTPSITKRKSKSEMVLNNIQSCLYQDRSCISYGTIATLLEQMEKPTRYSKEPPFPQKLHQILGNPNNHKCIMWLPHGRAFMILDKKNLEKEILPHYFKSSKLASFMRQVNNWGFDRIHFGPDSNAYYNEYFLRGLPHVSLKMIRQPKGKLQQRMQSIYSQMRLVPDLYEMSEEHPLPGDNEPSSTTMKEAKLSLLKRRKV